MTTKIAINGFGRIGRLAFRAAFDCPDLDIVQINEVSGGVEVAAHLLEFDTVHGRWQRDTKPSNEILTVAGKEIAFTSVRSPDSDVWHEKGAQIVLECSGKFRSPELLQPYFDRGVEKVLVAAPVKEGALNIVMGCNDHLYNPSEHKIVTAASCTTNCLAPIVKVIHENIGIHHGSITTIHNVTNTQVVVDAPHKDMRRARSALNSLIPTSTGSATAIGMIFPDLKGKLNGLAVRVPLLNSSLTDCVFEVKRKTSVEEVNSYFKHASETNLKGILGYEERPLVSADFLNDTRSSIVDALSTMVVNDTQLKVLSWYDNEQAYAHRLVELCRKVALSL